MPRIDRRKKRDTVSRVKTRELLVREVKGKGSRPGGKNSSNIITRRRKNPSIRPGMQLGHLYISQRVNTKKGSSGGQKWRCECSCGKVLTVPQWYLVRKEFPKRHCGCQIKGRAQHNNRERGIFYMMHRRCYNPTHIAYKHYGGAERPIQVCDPWNKDVVGNEVAWENFFRDMGPAPSKGHTLDRIDPFNGYGWWPDLTTGEVKLNCRWATASEQMNNLKRHWLTPEERLAKLAAEKFDVDLEDPEELEETTDGQEQTERD